jgi:hypothetical protein
LTPRFFLFSTLIRKLFFPFNLDFHFFFAVSAAFILEFDRRKRRYVNSLARDLNFKGFVLFERVG